MICETHNWTQKRLPCPWLRCPNGARGLWIVIGKRKKVVYVRARDKGPWGPSYNWRKTDLNPDEMLQEEPDDEEGDLIF